MLKRILLLLIITITAHASSTHIIDHPRLPFRERVSGQKKEGRLAVDSEGNTWVALGDSGVAVYGTDGKWDHLEDHFENTTVKKIYPSPSGKIWLLSDTTLILYDNKTRTDFAFRSNFKTSHLTSLIYMTPSEILIDKDGNTFAVVDSTYFRFTGTSWKKELTAKSHALSPENEILLLSPVRDEYAIRKVTTEGFEIDSGSYNFGSLLKRSAKALMNSDGTAWIIERYDMPIGERDHSVCYYYDGDSLIKKSVYPEIDHVPADDDHYITDEFEEALHINENLLFFQGEHHWYFADFSMKRAGIFSESHGLPKVDQLIQRPRKIVVDKNGTPYATMGDRGGISYYSGGLWYPTEFQYKKSNDIDVAADGSVWVAYQSWRGGIPPESHYYGTSNYVDGAVVHYYDTLDYPSYVKEIYPLSNGDIWFFTSNGYFKQATENPVSIQSKSVVKEQNIRFHTRARTLYFAGVAQNSGRISITTLSGRVVASQELIGSSGSMTFTLPSDIAAGVYTATLSTKSAQIHRSFIVK